MTYRDVIRSVLRQSERDLRQVPSSLPTAISMSGEKRVRGCAWLSRMELVASLPCRS